MAQSNSALLEDSTFATKVLDLVPVFTYKGHFASKNDLSKIPNVKCGDIVCCGIDSYVYVREGCWKELGCISESKPKKSERVWKIYSNCKYCGAVLPVKDTYENNGTCKCNYCGCTNQFELMV